MKETFDAAWLALREPLDHRSRAAAAVPLLVTAWRANGWSRVVDLGSGTGSNLRYLAPRLPGPQHWTLVDHDADLLARVSVPEGVERPACVTADLAGAGLAVLAAARAQVVTGSALLDLVSRAWLDRLVATCRATGCAAHFALVYDGSIQWHAAPDDPRAADDPCDGAIRRAVNAHQRRDKGSARRSGRWRGWRRRPRSGPPATASGCCAARGGCGPTTRGWRGRWSAGGRWRRAKRPAPATARASTRRRCGPGPRAAARR